MPLYDLTPQDARKVLQAIARNDCYDFAGSTPRKDFSKTNDVFDLALTSATFRSDRVLTTEAISNHQRFESVVVGCALTNDRMASTGWSDTPKCRFCDFEKESMPHLVFDCPRIGGLIGAPMVHEMGANFGILGHVHHPPFIARRRLLQNDPSAIVVPEEFNAEITAEIWTDGSVVFGENTWLATGAFAVLDSQRNIIHKGQVNHWSLSAYATELWAVVYSCSRAATGLHIYSDCKLVVEQVSKIFAGAKADPLWKCWKWWVHLSNLVTRRSASGHCPFHIDWIPAHRLEAVPIPLLTEELARTANTSLTTGWLTVQQKPLPHGSPRSIRP